MRTSQLIFIFTSVIVACALIKSYHPNYEGLDDKMPETKITNTRNDMKDLPLREYCIFASSNTALTGKRMELDKIKDILKRGCRFVDLEIYSIKGEPVVGYSTDKQKYNLEVDTTIPFGEALNQIVTIGFGETSNTLDPLFIQLRIRTSDKQLCNKMAAIIKEKISPRLYVGQIGNDALQATKLSKLMGKIVIIVDGEDSPEYGDLAKYIHIENGKYTVRKYTADVLSAGLLEPPNIKDDGKTTDLSIIKFVYPSNVNNPELRTLVPSYGAQIIMNRFYEPDYNLTETEKIFSDIGSAFVPMAQMLKYLKINDTTM